jgi:hypothetical protein
MLSASPRIKKQSHAAEPSRRAELQLGFAARLYKKQSRASARLCHFFIENRKLRIENHLPNDHSVIHCLLTVDYLDHVHS